MKTEIKTDQQSQSLFEISVSILIFAPVVFYLFSYMLGESAGLFASLLLPLLLLVVLFKSGVTTIRGLLSRFEFETAAVFIATFSFFFWACLQWPDFIAMGERLRDYALLSSVMDSPIVAKEPWMAGENLNYYLFWYRFAAYWSMIFGVSVWNTYHLLAAFSFSLFSTALFRLMRCYLGISLKASMLLAVLISIGSNLAGVLNAFSDSSDWWGPSRVIKGTINEFPAWSFLLGDLHPHFLNLALTPVLLCIAFAFIKSNWNWAFKLAAVLLLFLVSGALYYNSNAWEVPIAAIMYFIILVFAAYGFRKPLLSNLSQFPRLLLQNLKEPIPLSICLVLLTSLISLILSSRNIKPADFPWRLVVAPIPVSTLSEIMLHWGIALFAIVFALILRTASQISLAPSLCAALLSLAIATQNSLFVLSSILLWVIVEAVSQLKPGSSDSNNFGFSTISLASLYGLGASSLLLIILGELVFLDDPYGGENERMNTIFKIYSATWAPLHLFAFCLVYKALIKEKMQGLLLPAAIIISALTPTFFLHTIGLRKNPNPSSEGLASIEQQFPGSSDLIRYLRNQPRQITLEAQGNPYSYTTHIATLGNQESYLGWANHVGLLTGQHQEVSRRDGVTQTIYTEENCQLKKDLAKKEKIDLIVIGPLEREKYGPAVTAQFSCFSDYFSNSYYSVKDVRK